MRPARERSLGLRAERRRRELAPKQKKASDISKPWSLSWYSLIMCPELNSGSRKWSARRRATNAEAIRLYTKAIEATEKTPRLYYDYVSRGVAYVRKGQTAEAMKDFDEALKLKPDDLDARFRRGGLLVQRKQYEAAIEDFSKFLEADEDGTDPNRAMAFRLRGFSYNTLQQDEKAGADYEAACMINKQLDVCN